MLLPIHFAFGAKAQNRCPPLVFATSPKDFTKNIVSFGQAEGFDLYYCPITYLRQPIEELGKTAVSILVEKLKNPEQEIQQVLMETTLITRKSSRAKESLVSTQ